MTDQECEVTMTFSKTFADAQDAEKSAHSRAFTDVASEGIITNTSTRADGKVQEETTFVCQFSQDGTCLVQFFKNTGLPFPENAAQKCLSEAQQATLLHARS